MTTLRNPDCHYGDHDWELNGRCRHCDAFNGGLLQWFRFDKADKAGTLIWHGDPENGETDPNLHYHFTEKAAARCRIKEEGRHDPRTR